MIELIFRQDRGGGALFGFRKERALRRFRGRRVDFADLPIDRADEDSDRALHVLLDGRPVAYRVGNGWWVVQGRWCLEELRTRAVPDDPGALTPDPAAPCEGFCYWRDAAPAAIRRDSGDDRGEDEDEDADD